MSTRFIAATRHPDGKKNVYEIANAPTHAEARQTVLDQIGPDTVVLVGIDGGKGNAPVIIEKEPA